MDSFVISRTKSSNYSESEEKTGESDVAATIRVENSVNLVRNRINTRNSPKKKNSRLPLCAQGRDDFVEKSVIRVRDLDRRRIELRDRTCVKLQARRRLEPEREEVHYTVAVVSSSS